MSSTHDFESLIPHMKRAGLMATVLAALITSMFGWSLGENFLAKVSLAGLLALCTFIVAYALVAAHAAYKRGMYGVSVAATALFLVGVTVEFLSHTGFTAANRDATISQANFTTTAYEDTRGTIKDLEAKLSRATEERLLMKPKASVAAARATISTSEAHKLWRYTDGCKTTKGNQSRAFCDKYFSAQADVALWDQIAKQEMAIGEIEGELKEARANSSTKEIGHASGASQGRILAAMATGNMAPDSQAQFWSGVGISALLALFAICAGGLLNFVAFAFDTAGRAGRALASSVADAGTTIVQVQDDFARELAAIIRQAGSTLKAA